MMGWPQITVIVLFSIGMGIALVKHGEPSGTYSFGRSLIANAILIYLLWAGGFWS